MRSELITIIENIKLLRVPEDIFFLQSEIKRIVYCREQLKKNLRDLAAELQKVEIDTPSQDDELLLTEFTGHLIKLIKEIYMCGPTYYGSHNELYGGSISGLKRGENDGLHHHLQYPLEFLKKTALSITDDSSQNRLLPKVMELKILLEGYNRSLIDQARFKPLTSSHTKSTPCRASSIRPFFATTGVSKQLSVHEAQKKRGLNPNAQEFLPESRI